MHYAAGLPNSPVDCLSQIALRRSRHARTYNNVITRTRCPPRMEAALFLLTADRKLWRTWRKALTVKGIDRAVDLPRRELGWDAYFLEKAAKSIASQGFPQVTLHELTDRTDYPQELLRLIITALVIARGGPEREPKITYYKRKEDPKC